MTTPSRGAKRDSINRALFDLGDEDIPIKHAIMVAEATITQYQRGASLEDPLTREMFTDPDIVELAEDLAERVRSLLYEDEGWMDRVTDVAVDSARLDLGDTDEVLEMNPEQCIAWENRVTEVVMAMVRPLILNVLDTGDWRPDAG
jgi:hypothetical protein